MMAWHLAEPVTDQITKSDYWRKVAVGTEPKMEGVDIFDKQPMLTVGVNRTTAIHEFPLTDVR